jgi:hypothetical protein
MGEACETQIGAIATCSYLRIRKNEEREVFHLDEAMSQESVRNFSKVRSPVLSIETNIPDSERMSKRKPRYHLHRFPPEVISYATWLYHRFNLNFRYIEDFLAERGIEVSCESIRRWSLKFGPGFCRSICGFDNCRKIELPPITPTVAASDMRPVKSRRTRSNHLADR